MVINYKIEKVVDYVMIYIDDKGFDVVFDFVGGVNMMNFFEVVVLNGQIVLIVFMLELDLMFVYFKGLLLYVVFMLILMLYNYK